MSRCVSAAEPERYTHEIRPFLDRYCFDCHGEETVKANLELAQKRLEQYDQLLAKGAGRLFDAWEPVYHLSDQRSAFSKKKTASIVKPRRFLFLVADS